MIAPECGIGSGVFFVFPEVIARAEEAEPVAISGARLEELRALIQAGRKDAFYSWPEWQELRPEVLGLDNYECQRCKARGKFAPARIVHHVQHLEVRPDLALSVWDPDTGERQLVSVCKRCHEELHPESQRQFRRIRAPLTAERWD